MSNTELRDEVHKYVDQANDHLLQLVHDLMQADLAKDQELLRASIDRGISDSKEGKTRSHQAVMSELREKYKA